nr:hypothetical protein GCM10020093_004710 [Planobispora longispora]
MSYIIHKGDEKDLPSDQALDLTADGHEIWRAAATEGHVLPQAAARGADADLSKSSAHWIDRTTVAWKVRPSAALTYTLAFSAKGDIAYDKGDLTGDHRLIRLSPGSLTDAQKAKWPHLAGHAALTVDPRDAGLVQEALRGQVVAVERDASGVLLTATGVQIPGVLDDVYAGAAAPSSARTPPARCPACPSGRRPRARWSWRSTGTPPAEPQRARDAPRRRHRRLVGAGPAAWKGRYYTFLVTVYSPPRARSSPTR